MPNTPTTAWDGHGPMFGVDSRTHPAQLTSQFSVSSVNRSFRGGLNDTRPPIQSKVLRFETSADEEAFKFGNIAGAFAYSKTFRNTQPHLIVAAGQKLLKGRMYANTIEFSTLHDLETPRYMHGWFAQGEDRLYYQNGVNDPVGWDGRSDAYSIEGGIANDKMPIGTIMVYHQGRLIVFTEDNHAIVSDYIYGSGVSSTAGLESFIETQGFNDIGALGTPSSLDSITGAISIPRTPNRNGQGDLLVVTKRGAYTLRLTGVRADWLFGDIMQIVLTGVGGASHNSLVAANNDIWFRTSGKDISSYKFERSELDRTWGDTSLSREVSKYLHLDSSRNLQYCSTILAHNRLITTCAHTVRAHDEDGFGHHRFGQGLAVLDFDKGSTVNQKPGFAWDGLWTGINASQLVSLTVDQELRPLAISHDEDGENRVYEFMPDEYGGSDMADGDKKKIVSFYETPYLLDQRDPTGRVVGKRLTGGRAEVSKVAGSATFKALFRPNYYPCWQEFSSELTVGAERQSTDVPVDSKPFYDILRWGEPDTAGCEEASQRMSATGAFFSVRIEVVGNLAVDMLQIHSEVHNEDEQNTCTIEGREEMFQNQITCAEPGLFDYKIITGE